MSSYAFTKLFSSITESTIWFESDQTRIMWITLLALADKHGRIQSSVPGLAHRARVPLEAAQIALDKFLAPDLESRTPDQDGRRIEKMDGGWRLVNYAKYRELRDDEDQAKRVAEKSKRYRERKKLDPPPATNPGTSHHLETIDSVTDRHLASPPVTHRHPDTCDSSPIPSRIVTSHHPIAEADKQIADKHKVLPNPETGSEEKQVFPQSFSPEQIARAVREDTGLSGRELTIVLDEVCRSELKKNRDSDELRHALTSSWWEYQEAKPRLNYPVGAQKFFGEGVWKNKSAWPWKPGESAKAPPGAKKLSPLEEHQERVRLAMEEKARVG